VSLPWNMQMGRYTTAYQASFLWPSREFLMMCEADRPLGSEGPAKVQTARRALTPNPAFAGAQKSAILTFRGGGSEHKEGHHAKFARAVNALEKAGCFRNNTPNHTLTDLKARQAFKIREIGEALITTGFVSLDAQAKILGLPRSTAWRILSAEHKGTGISARIICRMLNSEPLPPLVRAKIVEYAKEKAAGIYGGTETQHRRFTSKLALYGLGERRIRLHDVP
jgi:hypothetical protein